MAMAYLPPANEVSEGYVFTPVCQSFCSRWGAGSASRGICIHPGGSASTQGGSASREGLNPVDSASRVDPPWDTTGCGQRADGMHSTGMHF